MSGQCRSTYRGFACQRIGRHAWCHNDASNREWRHGGTSYRDTPVIGTTEPSQGESK